MMRTEAGKEILDPWKVIWRLVKEEERPREELCAESSCCPN